MNNKNYRVLKFFEPVNKEDKYKGYVRLAMRGNRGNMIVAAENLGDAKSTSEVYLYKDKHNKIKLGDINNKKGIIKKMLTFENSNAIEDYNVCAVVKDGRIVLYSSLFTTSSQDIVRKLEDNVKEKEKEIFSNEKQKLQELKADKPREIKQIDTKVAREVIEPKEIIEAKGLRDVRAIKEKGMAKAAENKPEDEIKEEVTKAIQEPVKTIKVPVKKEEIKEAIKEDNEEAEEIPEKLNKDDVSNQGYRNRFDEKLYRTLRDFKEVEPLSVKLKNFKWWYIPYDEMGIKNGILPYYNQIISTYYPYPMSNRVTTCASLMKKYGHYIFGIYKEKDEIAKFIYGIPGEFTKEEQPYKGVTGFKNWSYANNDNKGESGYWLAFVNPKTGETTDPPQVSLT
ncbi:MAG: hypothetical protein PHS04_01385 [Tissierellia bacterium]|nr:hypothetical protein [Tissierellia bacterium]